MAQREIHRRNVGPARRTLHLLRRRAAREQQKALFASRIPQSQIQQRQQYRDDHRNPDQNAHDVVTCCADAFRIQYTEKASGKIFETCGSASTGLMPTRQFFSRDTTCVSFRGIRPASLPYGVWAGFPGAIVPLASIHRAPSAGRDAGTPANAPRSQETSGDCAPPIQAKIVCRSPSRRTR